MIGDRSVRFWSVVGGIATTLGVLVTLVAQAPFGGQPRQPDAAITTTPATAARSATSPTDTAGGRSGASPSLATSPVASSPAAAEPPVLLVDQVNLAMRSGADVDGGTVHSPLVQGAAGVDLYLDWGYMLSASVLHGEMYDDTDQGDAAGAYSRCAGYRQLARTTIPSKYIGAGMQLCITTSDGRPGWIQVNSIPLDQPGSAILKVVIWQK